MAGFKISTYEETTANNTADAVAPPILQNPVLEESPNVVEKPIEPSETVVTTNGELKTHETEKPKEEPKVEIPVIEENTSNVSIPDFGSPKVEVKEGESAASQTTDWKTVLKSIDPKEILKELGINEFALQLNEHLQKGGNAEDYLNAKAVDWNKVSDRDMVLQSLKNELPNLDADEIKELFEDTYKQGELHDDEDKRRGAIRMKADAYKMRQSEITKQQQFKLPEAPIKQNEVDTAEQQRIARQQAEQIQKFFTEHEATQNLIKSKRVAINLGEGIKPFNFNVDKPEALIKPMLDSEAWQRVVAVNPEEPDKTKLIPDVAKLQKLILVAVNPNYERDIYNAGKSAGEKGLVDEGKNAVRPITKPSVPIKETFKEKWKNPKISTYGAPA